MHAVPAFDDHIADDELSVYSLAARIAEALRSNEYPLHARGIWREQECRFRYIGVARKSFTTGLAPL
jgi:hypothetical protein